MTPTETLARLQDEHEKLRAEPATVMTLMGVDMLASNALAFAATLVDAQKNHEAAVRVAMKAGAAVERASGELKVIDREGWKQSLDAAQETVVRELIEENATLESQLAVLNGEACDEERAAGNGPCGICTKCYRTQLAAMARERDDAQAKSNDKVLEIGRLEQEIERWRGLEHTAYMRGKNAEREQVDALVDAAWSLTNEVVGIHALIQRLGLNDQLSNTNVNCLARRCAETRKALAPFRPSERRKEWLTTFTRW